VQDLDRAFVATGSGRAFPLKTFFSFSTQLTPGRITRENQEYIRWIRCEYKGPYEEGQRILQRATAGLPLPPGYGVRIVPPTEEITDDEQRSLWWWLWIAAAIVFMASAAYFDSCLKAGMVITGSLISLVGPFLLFGFSSLPIVQSAYAVLLLLISVVMTQAFLSIDSVTAGIERKGPAITAIVGAWSSRLAGILMSTTAALAVIVPFLWIADRTTLWYPAGWGFAAGLLAAFIVNLIVLPVGFASMVVTADGRRKRWISRGH
jgi:multidrug efflux pump subunit AcrB